MVIRVAVGTDPKELLRCVLDGLKDPDVDSIIVHKAGSAALLANGDERLVDADGRWAPAIAQADGCGR